MNDENPISESFFRPKEEEGLAESTI